MTTIQDCLTGAFQQLLSVGGVRVVPSTGGEVLAVVAQAVEFNDPVQSPKVRQPVYTRVACKAGAVANPALVSQFKESSTGRIHTTLRYTEDVMGIKDEWICERQRT
jgi:hypothetical protein